jgi:hypothetical protein
MQISSTHLDDIVDEERSNNCELNWSNWAKVLKSDKLREVETLHFELELAMHIRSTHSHDTARVINNGNWVEEIWFWSKLELGWVS